MAELITQSRSAGVQPRYKVWHAFNVPNNMDEYAVKSVAEAKDLILKLIKEDLDSDDVSSNAFGLVELESDGYHEWYDDEGRRITDLMDEEDN